MLRSLFRVFIAMSFYSNADPSPTAGLDIRSADRIDDFVFRVGWRMVS
jgi:hypothetical protein